MRPPASPASLLLGWRRELVAIVRALPRRRAVPAVKQWGESEQKTRDLVDWRYCGRVVRQGSLRSKGSLCLRASIAATPAATQAGTSERRKTAREIVSFLRGILFVGRISPTQLALLVPRGVALAELNLDREPPFTSADLMRALKELHISDYPQREASVSGALRQQDPEAPPATLLPEGSYEVPYPLEYYEDGFPKLPACLDRKGKSSSADTLT